MNSSQNFQLSFWLASLSFITFLMILIGGLTRLTDSGLSMVDWRPFLGTIPPLSYESWIKVFEAYKNTPEYLIVNNSMGLDEFKVIFWWEWFHRFLARFLGLVFIFPLIYFLIKRAISKKLLIILIIVFIFGIFQAFVGWWMVKSGLNENPYVSPYRLTFHLSNALIIFSILFWNTLIYLYNKQTNFISQNTIEFFFLIGIFLLFITIVSGGFMAGTHAGKSFNTYPLMNGLLFPEDYFISGNGIRNLFENIVAINFNHRWLASFTFVYIVSLMIYSYFTFKDSYSLSILPILLVILFSIIQFLLGILTLLSNVKIYLASMHQVNSVILLTVLLYSYYKLKKSNF